MASLPALRERYGPRYAIWLTAVLMAGSMTMILAATSINVALPAIMRDFSIGRPLAQWLATGFLAAMTAGLLLAAGSQARLGARRTAQLALGLFTLASVLALIANQAWQLIGLRVVQGLCAGLLQPLSMVLIFRLFEGPGRGLALGIYGFCVMLAPTLGPSIGGYLIDHFDWHAVFWMPLPLCLLALVAGYWLLPDERRQAARIDFLAFLWLCVAIFGLLGALGEAQRNGWSSLGAWLPALVGGVAGVAFVWRSKHQAQPLLPLALWRNGAFRSASWVALTLGMGLYGSTYLLPLYLQTVEGYNAGRAGLLLLPTAFVLGLASFLRGWATDRFSSALLLAGGMLVFGLSMAGLGWVEQGASFLLLGFWACLGRLGLGLVLPALSTGSMDVLEPDELAQGAGAITFIRQLGGAFGISLLSYFLEWRHWAEGSGLAHDAEAFRQTFWLVAVLFMLSALPALGVRRYRILDPHP